MVYVTIERSLCGNVVHRKIGERLLSEVEVMDKAEVAVELGITKNLGNYESLRVSVYVKRPVENNEQSIKLGILETKQLAEAYLHKFVLEALTEGVPS